VNIYLFIYLILFNINDRKTRKPLILSEVHKKYTNIHKYTQYEKVFKNRNKQKDKKNKSLDRTPLNKFLPFAHCELAEDEALTVFAQSQRQTRSHENT